MANRAWLVAGILVPYFLFLGSLESMAQQLSPNSIIVGGSSDQGLDFRTLASRTLLGNQTTISVSPFLAGMLSNSDQFLLEIDPIQIDLASAASILTATKATAVWDYGSIGAPPSLHVMPFDVHMATHAQDWDRVSMLLSPGEENRLVILPEPDNTNNIPIVLNSVHPDGIRAQWDELFSRYLTVRVLALPNVIYVRPVSDGVREQRAAVFERHVSDIQNLRESPETGSPVVVDRIFMDLSARSANSDAIAALDVVWQTSIRDLFERDSLGSSEIAKVTRFAHSLEEVVTLGDEPSKCLVTISTTHGAGAEIWYFKTLLGPGTAVQAVESSPLALRLERALWTFVARRNGQETGREERVRLPHDEPTVPLLIDEG